MDDDSAIRDLVGELLSDEGYRVELAEDGQQALERMRAAPGRMVVLLDVMMPVLDGIEVLRRVAADATLARRHGFLLMTASVVSDSPDLPRLIREFNALMLRKPFSIEELIERTNTVAGRLTP